jgi:hemin uptake protein HemP
MSPHLASVPPPGHSHDPAPIDGPARVSSQSLLGSRGELLIVHNGREYRLRVTQNGKLILTA